MSQHWSISLVDRNFYLVRSLKFSFSLLKTNKQKLLNPGPFQRKQGKYIFKCFFILLWMAKAYFHLNIFLKYWKLKRVSKQRGKVNCLISLSPGVKWQKQTNTCAFQLHLLSHCNTFLQFSAEHTSNWFIIVFCPSPKACHLL